MLKILDLNIQKEDFTLTSEQPLCFQEGHLHLIKGASGSGKTALLYILGLISDSMDFKYHYYGQNITTKKQKDLLKKREIGFVYQNFNMIETLNLYENLKMFASLKGQNLSKKKAKELLAMVRLEGISLSRLPSQLSGGQKQRFCLACILAKNPQVIIADEPTSALDQKNADMMMLILKRLAQDYHKIVIVSTHTKRYDGLADEVFHIQNGKVNCLNLCAEMKVYNKRKLKETKVKFDFYKVLLNHQLTQLFTKYRLFLVLSVLIFSFGIAMRQYFNYAMLDYENQIQQSIKDEVILTTSIYDEDEAKALEDKVVALNNVKAIYPLYVSFGNIIDENGLESQVSIYPIYPFQVTEDVPNVFYGDSSFLGYMDKKYTLQIGEKQNVYQLKDIIDEQRLSAYGELERTVFIPASEFSSENAFFTGKYVIEMTNFEAFDGLKDALLLMNKDFEVQNTFRDMMIIQNSMALNRIYQNIAFVIMNVIIFVLLCYTLYHEFIDKKKMLCVYQANGLSKKDVVYLEGLEAFVKVLSYFICSIILITIMMMVSNHFFLTTIKQHFDMSMFAMILVMLGIEIVIPHVVLLGAILHMNIEETLRANS